MKKLVVFILLLVTTICIIYPCCSLDDGCADKFSTSTNTEKHDAEGACSPFFACATCPGFVELSQTLHLIKPLTQMQVHYETLILFDLSTYTPSFWQPPRTS